MASFQAKQRDPLFDSKTQAFIEQRGKELIGICLLIAALIVTLMYGTFDPEDPGFFAATDAPVHNAMGTLGATIASATLRVFGAGVWFLPLALAVWGTRLIAHVGEDRVLISAFFLLPTILLATYGYTHTTDPGLGFWAHYGEGGELGEMIAALFVTLLPFSAALSIKIVSLVVFALLVLAGAWVLGVNRREWRIFARFLLVGVITIYATVRFLLSRGAVGAVNGAQTMHRVHRERRAAKVAAAEAEPVVHRAGVEPEYDPEPAPQPGLFARVGVPFRRAPDPEPELVEPTAHLGDAPSVSEDHIRARIADVVRNRAAQGKVVAPPPTGRAEPPLMAAEAHSIASAAVARRRGPKPLIADTAPKYAPPPQPLAADEPLADAPMPVVEDSMPVPENPEFENIAPPQPVQRPSFAAPAVTRQSVVQHPPKKPVQPSRQAQAEAQPQLMFDEAATQYEHPPLALLTNPTTIERHHLSDEALEENARMLENVLEDYGVKGEIVSVRPGPVVTMYELEPAPGLKASRVIGLADDIARSMSALSARVSTVPGRSVIGIELPNLNREKVVLREILSSRDFGDGNQRLPLALGKDIGGDSVVANLAKMPHLLIAGTTGSGKSVAINTMILSLLYKLTPEECRLIMIDPKMLELSVYDGIPHLLSPVVTDPKKAVVALKWVVGEMEDRYRKMSKMGVRNIEGYNGRVRDAQAKGELFSRTVQTGFDEDTGEPIFETEEFAPELLPFIVVVVDEMADLMMVAGKEIEACIQRLAQMARASGIHLIMATQRPSVDVITGTIKANFPTRISFQVTSKVDSRTILGEQGAEQLLGMGDMLYMAGGSKITRVHGPFVSDEEVEEIVNYLKAFGPPDYMSGVVDGPDEEKESDIDLVLGLGGNTDAEDALYDTAVQIVIKDRKCSTSYIQRKLAIGYNKAARLVEQMEENGLVSPANHVGKREILVPDQQ
ncbi:cell division protein FtsK [Actibacterium mucosum KCTC 23349]|uniref:DNA translocase FtsK n=1 Tax=Actibacterium mucosum KCTC 23349 TaxID=1454373 RepID=A0A037ZPM2_9RHOB|nr:DNA translocase FtsK [Actibacterium mucosum]KAJ57478.1 cell division protein FtsK [Actibacterium mucosum KCTC 23349]